VPRWRREARLHWRRLLHGAPRSVCRCCCCIGSSTSRCCTATSIFGITAAGNGVEMGYSTAAGATEDAFAECSSISGSEEEEAAVQSESDVEDSIELDDGKVSADSETNEDDEHMLGLSAAASASVSASASSASAAVKRAGTAARRRGATARASKRRRKTAAPRSTSPSPMPLFTSSDRLSNPATSVPELAMQPLVILPAASKDATAASSPAPPYSQPRDGDVVLFHYQCRHTSGSIYAKSRDVWFAGTTPPSAATAQSPTALCTPAALDWMVEYEGVEAPPMHATLGTNELIPVWEHAFKTMYKGEYATILARENNDNRSNLPKAMTLTTMVCVHELQLIDFW
jgi:hypothetical protein